MTISIPGRNLRPIIVACVVLAAGPLSATQRPCADFVERSGVHLSCGGNPFYAIGVNSYFLENIAALNDTDRVNEVFREAVGLGATTLRTWAFFDCPDTSNPAC